ncbi:WG repeat-containing protein [Flexithrix dorotheae]|uniref:WG repeat-containing protein n=1 Tax=Flexithrix dorotheae TaxID=70993 RepID=UPI0003756D6A|nr:WG repeat-containing protein [Flexithrix dorotheae]
MKFFKLSKTILELAFSIFFTCILSNLVWGQSEFPVPFQSEENQLFGYILPSKNKIVVEPIFQKASPFAEGNAIVKLDGKFGLINKKGKYLIDCKYDSLGWANTDSLPKFYNDKVGFKQGSFWGLITVKGEEVVSPQFHSINFFEQQIAKVGMLNSDNWAITYGAIAEDGSFVIQPQFTQLERDETGQFFKTQIQTEDQRKVGLYSLNGKELIPCKYNQLKELGDGIFAGLNDMQLWEIYNSKGEKISDLSFIEVFPFEHGKAIAIKDYRFGIIEPNGNVLVDFRNKSIVGKNQELNITPFTRFSLAKPSSEKELDLYCDSLQNIAPDVFQIFMNGKAGWVNKENELFGFDTNLNLTHLVDDLLIIKSGNKVGVINSKWQNIIPIAYDKISLDKSGLIRATKLNQPELFNTKGENITNGNYDFISEFSNEFYLIEANGQKIFTDKKLNPVFSFENAKPFKHDYAPVAEGGLFGVIDSDGKWIISPYIDDIQVINHKYFVFHDNNEWGTVNPSGIELYKSSLKYKVLESGCVEIEEKGKKGLLNQFGSLMLEPVYDSISKPSDDGIIKVYKKGQMTFMDIEEKDAPNFKAFSGLEVDQQSGEKLFRAKIMNSYGFLDYLGRIRISNRYENVQNFSENLAGFQLNGRWGYIDKRESFVIQPKFEEVYPFKKGFAKIKQEGKFGIINKQEKKVIAPEWDNIQRSAFGNFIIKKDGKYGMISSKDFSILYPRYEEVQDCGNDYIILLRDGKYGVNQINGITFIYPEYQEVIFNQIDNSFFTITRKASYTLAN